MEKLAIGSMSPGSPVSRTDAIVQVDTDDVLDVESGRDRVVVEIVEQREAVLPVRRLVELDGEDLTVDAVDIAGRTYVRGADQHAAGESKLHIGALRGQVAAVGRQDPARRCR